MPLAIATTFANLVVLLAMRRVTSIRLPPKLLLCSLVLTDLGAGSIVQPQLAAFLFLRAIYPDFVPCSLVRSYAVTGPLFTKASLSTVAAISLDRYAALFSSINRLLRPGEFVQCSPSYGLLSCSLSLHPSFALHCGMQALWPSLPSRFSSLLSPAPRSTAVSELSRFNPKLPTKRSNRRETHWTWSCTGGQRPPWCGSACLSWSATSP